MHYNSLNAGERDSPDTELFFQDDTVLFPKGKVLKTVQTCTEYMPSYPQMLYLKSASATKLVLSRIITNRQAQVRHIVNNP